MSDPQYPEDAPRCKGTGERGDHAWDWTIHTAVRVHCTDCGEKLTMKTALEIIEEYHRIVQTGISILQGELDELRADFEAAASDMAIPQDTLMPGSMLRRVVISNRLLQHARDNARAHAHEAWQRLSQVLRLIEEGRPHADLAVTCHSALEKVSGLP